MIMPLPLVFRGQLDDICSYIFRKLVEERRSGEKRLKCFLYHIRYVAVVSTRNSLKLMRMFFDPWSKT